MKTIVEILKLSTEYLQKQGISHARRQAEEIISDALGLKRLQLYINFDRPVTEDELALCRGRLARRAKGEPLQYIHGEVQFHDCTIRVSPAVLIPRQETEILVNKIYKQLLNLPLENSSLWDVCCGSGCIGIAMKKLLPALKVTLSDVSNEALLIAQENARINNVDVEFLQGDLLTPFQERKTQFLICNPPYIAEREYGNLDREVRNYEPRNALISGETGLEFYERLAKDLPARLLPHGKAWFEVGTGQGPALIKLFNQPPWSKCEIEKDWSGHDRFFFLEIE